jgi:hypothetical protein
MISATAYVLFYAVVAALSPVVFTATVIVLRSARPRTNGIAFLTGFVVGTTLAAIVGLIVGEAIVTRVDSHQTIQGFLALVLGVALIGVGLRERRTPSAPVGTPESGRMAAILAGLGRVGPGAAVSMAGLLGFGGPKRLVLTLLAMAAISQAGLGDVADVTLLVLYVAVATVLVSVPVVVVLIAGRRAAEIIARCQSWIEDNRTLLSVWMALAFGVALVVDGLFRIVGA